MKKKMERLLTISTRPGLNASAKDSERLTSVKRCGGDPSSEGKASTDNVDGKKRSAPAKKFFHGDTKEKVQKKEKSGRKLSQT